MKINDTKAKTHIAFSSSTPVLMSPFLLMMLSLVSLSSTTTQAIQFWRVRKNIERCSHSHIKSLFREALNVKMRMGWKLFWAVFQFHMRWAEELEAALPVRRACRVPFSQVSYHLPSNTNQPGVSSSIFYISQPLPNVRKVPGPVTKKSKHHVTSNYDWAKNLCRPTVLWVRVDIELFTPLVLTWKERVEKYLGWTTIYNFSLIISVFTYI